MPPSIYFSFPATVVAQHFSAFFLAIFEIFGSRPYFNYTNTFTQNKSNCSKVEAAGGWSHRRWQKTLYFMLNRKIRFKPGLTQLTSEYGDLKFGQSIAIWIIPFSWHLVKWSTQLTVQTKWNALIRLHEFVCLCVCWKAIQESGNGHVMELHSIAPFNGINQWSNVRSPIGLCVSDFAADWLPNILHWLLLYIACI